MLIFSLWYFCLTSRKKWHFLPSLWLFHAAACSYFVLKELFGCQLKVLQLVWTAQWVRTPPPASHYRGRQRLNVVSRHADMVPAGSSPATLSGQALMAPPCLTSPSSLGPANHQGMGLCLRWPCSSTRKLTHGAKVPGCHVLRSPKYKTWFTRVTFMPHTHTQKKK